METIETAPVRRLVWGICASLLVASAGCLGFGDESLEQLEPEAAPLEPSWQEHVQPLLDRYCVACHSSDAPGIQRATPFLTDLASASIASCRILVRAVEEQSMPPGAMERLSNVERLTVRRWVVNLYGGSVPACPDRIEQ